MKKASRKKTSLHEPENSKQRISEESEGFRGLAAAGSANERTTMRENLSRAQTTNGSFFLPTGLKVYTALVTLLLGLLLFCPLQEIYTQTTMSNANGERERTFIMVKPDGVQRGLVGEIIRRFEKKGFKLVALKFKWADEALLQQHYADLSSKPFFNGLVKYMRSGPVCPMVWEGLNVVKTGRQMLGETNPADSLPGTIRGDYCIEIGRNICHGSDAVDSAKKEMNLWFTPEELVQWKANEEPWLYE